MTWKTLTLLPITALAGFTRPAKADSVLDTAMSILAGSTVPPILVMSSIVFGIFGAVWSYKRLNRRRDGRSGENWTSRRRGTSGEKKRRMITFVRHFHSKDEARERACELCEFPLTFNSKEWLGHPPHTIECSSVTYDGDRSITTEFSQAHLPFVEMEEGWLVRLNMCVIDGVPAFASADFNEFDFGTIVEA